MIYCMHYIIHCVSCTPTLHRPSARKPPYLSLSVPALESRLAAVVVHVPPPPPPTPTLLPLPLSSSPPPPPPPPSVYTALPRHPRHLSLSLSPLPRTHTHTHTHLHPIVVVLRRHPGEADNNVPRQVNRCELAPLGQSLRARAAWQPVRERRRLANLRKGAVSNPPLPSSCFRISLPLGERAGSAQFRRNFSAP